MLAVYKCEFCKDEVELLVSASNKRDTRVCKRCNNPLHYVEIPKPSDGTRKNHTWKRKI